MHQPVSRGLAVFADAWLLGWLAEISADLRENGSALEVVLHDYALYKSTFTLGGNFGKGTVRRGNMSERNVQGGLSYTQTYCESWSITTFDRES